LTKPRSNTKKGLRNIDKSHGISLIREAEREVTEQIQLLEKSKAPLSSVNFQRPDGFGKKREQHAKVNWKHANNELTKSSVNSDQSLRQNSTM
jgi:hypothetical protein